MSNEILSAGAFSASSRSSQGAWWQAHQLRVGSWLAFAWQRILLATILLDLCLQMDAFLFHDADDAKFGAISGFNISVTTICLFFLYLQWLPRVIVQSAPVFVCKTLAIYVGVTALSILWAVDRNRTLFELVLLGQSYLMFIYIANNLKTRNDILFVMTFLLIGLSVEGAMMVATRILGHGIGYGPIKFALKDDLRVTGAFGSPNVASSYVSVLLAPCFSLLLLPVSRRLKMFAAVALLLSGVGLVMTMSRGGWLAAAVSMTIFGVYAGRQGWLTKAFFGLVALVLVLVAVGFHQVFAERLLGDDSGSAASRMPLNRISREMIAEYPLGVGANNWDRIAERVQRNESIARRMVFYRSQQISSGLFGTRLVGSSRICRVPCLDHKNRTAGCIAWEIHGWRR